MSVSAKFVRFSKLTVPYVYQGIVSSTDGRIQCGPGFANCFIEYQGAPTVNLRFARLPAYRQIVVGWSGCFIPGMWEWIPDTWTSTSSGCSLVPGEDSKVSPVLSTLPEATTQILLKSVMPATSRQKIQSAAQQIQAGTNCAANLSTFVRELTLLYGKGGISAADGLILVSGAKSLCPSTQVTRARR